MPNGSGKRKTGFSVILTYCVTVFVKHLIRVLVACAMQVRVVGIRIVVESVVVWVGICDPHSDAAWSRGFDVAPIDRKMIVHQDNLNGCGANMEAFVVALSAG